MEMEILTVCVIWQQYSIVYQILGTIHTSQTVAGYMIYVCTQDNGSPTEKHGFCFTTNLKNFIKTICEV